jgi:hypothetical protein
MSSTYALDAFRSHELSIEMRTSSGDVLSLDMAQARSLQMAATKDENGTSAGFTFSSMQAFNFSMSTNGIDAQDKAEISAMMEIAKPYLDRFMSELEEGDNTTPRNQVAQNIADAFAPYKGEEVQGRDHAKNGIVKMFDHAVARAERFEKVIDEAQKLLETTLGYFDRTEAPSYA